MSVESLFNMQPIPLLQLFAYLIALYDHLIGVVPLTEHERPPKYLIFLL
jgi:hypothetical protein